MYQNSFQSGPYVELANPSEKTPQWSINKPKWKLFEKTVKGYIISLDSHNAKLQLPSNDKQSLALIQPYLVLQVYLTPGQPFTLDLAISDISGTKRRLLFSSASKEIVSAPLHSRIPNWPFLRGAWSCISIDMSSFVTACFPGNTFRSLDSITVHSFCKIRRIFTMKNPLFELSENSAKNPQNCENVPKVLEFPPGVQFSNQNVGPELVMTPESERSGLSVRSKKEEIVFEDRIPVATAPIRNLPKSRQKTVSPRRNFQSNTTNEFFNKSLLNKTKTIDKTPQQAVKRKGSAGIPIKKVSHKPKNHSISNEENQNIALNTENSPKQKRFRGFSDDHEVHSKFSNENRYEDLNESEIKESIVIEKSSKNLSNCSSFVNQSIQEEIEIDRQSPQNNPHDLIEHNFFPAPAQITKNSTSPVPLPNFYDKNLSEMTKFRPFTPPFSGLASMQNLRIPKNSQENQLIYDSILNCYYDPSSQEYYKIK
ncbi:unnamed protein product [Blepharisma stoltei]|uniref:CFA20 domain-containing protein n=1 Tax=Blepharisma stoltei TaxID=1481888 RepID=A0AAU9JYZ7_9CILI|nr:unnamed protein product [Blepharisma stoltei]